ncbi:MAG: hypothetical protein R2939_16515 [Kofleriaceae bacterium]
MASRRAGGARAPWSCAGLASIVVVGCGCSPARARSGATTPAAGAAMTPTAPTVVTVNLVAESARVAVPELGLEAWFDGWSDDETADGGLISVTLHLASADASAEAVVTLGQGPDVLTVGGRQLDARWIAEPYVFEVRQWPTP